MKPTAGQISVAARMGATDRQICDMLGINLEELMAKHSATILQARTERVLAENFQIRKHQAGKIKPPAPKST